MTKIVLRNTIHGVGMIIIIPFQGHERVKDDDVCVAIRNMEDSSGFSFPCTTNYSDTITRDERSDSDVVRIDLVPTYVLERFLGSLRTA